MPITMKRAMRRMLGRMGYELCNLSPGPKSRSRALGGLPLFLRDVERRGFSPNVILDVGANRGEWATEAARVFPSARFVLVEPQREMAPHLEAFCKRDPASTYALVAAGSGNGAATLTVWPDLNGSSMMATSRESASSVERREIPVRTIDHILEESGQPTPELAKLDIQGAEIEALMGAQRLFGATEMFIIESSFFPNPEGVPGFADVVRFMDERDYKVFDFCNFLPRPADGALGQADVVFVKRSGWFRRIEGWTAGSPG